MGQVAYLQKVASRFQHFYTYAAGRWIDAIGKASAGTYTATTFAQDVVTASAKGVEAWLSLLDDGGSPIVPTINLSDTADTVKNKGVSITGYLERVLEPPAVMTCTSPLILLGQAAPANPVDMVVGFPSAWHEEIKVTIRAHNAGAGDPNPTAGTYVGGVFDPGGELIAQVVATIS